MPSPFSLHLLFDRNKTPVSYAFLIGVLMMECIDLTGSSFPCNLCILHVKLNFIGVTVELKLRYIHFTSTKHVFTPIGIGTYDPPKQVSD